MRNQYNVVTTFRARGRLPNGMAVGNGAYPGPRGMEEFYGPSYGSWRALMPLHRSDLAEELCIPLPVNGAPVPARETLLATILRNAKLLGGLTRANSDPNLYHAIAGSMNATRLVGRLRNLSGESVPPYRFDVYKAAKRRMIGRLLGIEIECYGPRLDSIQETDLLVVGHDGSIGDGGREIRKLTWVGDGGRINGLLKLRPYLVGAHVDRTCGLHVHVDVRDLPANGDDRLLSPEETYDRLTQMYRHLKRLVPRSRWTNNYCEWTNNRPHSPRYRRPRMGDRYAAINWLSYSEHGTLEFRCAAGSANVVKIESWALLCQHLVKHLSVRAHPAPTTWRQFLSILPRWLASWCVLRHAKLHSISGGIGPRVASACDLDMDNSSSDYNFCE